MERKIKIVDKNDAGFDASYWANKSSEERVSALEQLRIQYLTKNGTRQRLQRVYRIVERQQS